MKPPNDHELLRARVLGALDELAAGNFLGSAADLEALAAELRARAGGHPSALEAGRVDRLAEVERAREALWTGPRSRWTR